MLRWSIVDRLRHRGSLLAVLLVSGAVGFRYGQYRDEIRSYDRFNLPTFDPYVYVAMAEHPQFFTIAPWGYRILTPLVVHWMPVPTLRGYRYLCLGGLVASGLLLYAWLRRLGHGEGPSLLAILAFGLSGPVSEAIQSPVLSEPVALALEIGFLLALEAGAPLAALSLILVLGTFTKEIFILFPPLVYLARWRRRGHGRALLAAALVTVPPLLATAILRLWWTPYLHTPRPPLTLALANLAVRTLIGPEWSATWPALVLAGLTPLALLGALRKGARPFLGRYGYVTAAMALLPVVAWINVPGTRAVILLGSNVLRLMIYALPFISALALHALDRIWPHIGPPPVSRPPRPVWAPAAAVGLAASLVFPFVTLDRYRRVEFRPVRDGPLVLTLCRSSLKTARQIEQGKVVTWDLAEMGFAPGSDPGALPRMRWFLREGWGPDLHYGTGEVHMAERTATLIVPSFDGADRSVTLALSGAAQTFLDVAVNGTSLTRVAVGPEVREVALRLPGSLLFRGDNLLTLALPEGVTPGGPRLHRVTIGAAR